VRVEPTSKATIAGFTLLSLLVLYATGRGGLILGVTAFLTALLLASSYAEAVKASQLLYKINVTREHPSRIPEGSPVEVILHIKSKSTTSDSTASYLEIQENASRRLRLTLNKWRIDPREEAYVKYEAIPAPGLHLLEELVLSTGDSLGFFKSYRLLKVKTALAVYPLSLREKEIQGLKGGWAEPVFSRKRGLSYEFYQLREYQPGDDIRLVSWSATARTGKLMVREGVEEVRENIALFIDLSAPSWPGEPGESTADWIMRTALDLASSSVRAGGRVYFTIFRGEIWEDWGPLTGREAVDQLRFRLSMAGPSTVKRRFKFAESLERFLKSAPPNTVKVLMLGPAVNVNTLVETVKNAGYIGCRNIIAVFSPTGRGKLCEAAKLVNELVVRDLSKRLSPLGVKVYHIQSVGGVEEFESEVAGKIYRGTC
jgi:uncharacterized protein (DUF58 family)